MCLKKILLLVLLLFGYYAVAEQQYLITEQQIQSIEVLLEKLEKSNQNWQLQVQESKSEVSILKEDSITLNYQLLTERISYKNLNELYNKLESSRLNELTIIGNELANEKINNEKLKNQRNIFIFLFIILVVGLVSTIVIKLLIKKYFR